MNASAKDVSLNSLPAVDALNSSDIYMGRARLVLDRYALDPEASDSPDLRSRARKFLDESDDWYRKYDVIPRESVEDGLAQKVVASRATVRAAIELFGRAIDSRDRPAITRIATQELPAAYNQASEAYQRLRKFQLDDAAAQSQENERSFFKLQIIGVASLCIGVFAAISGWLSLRRAIVAPLAVALDEFKHISIGDLTRDVPIQKFDEMGQLLTGVKDMKQRLSETVGVVRNSSEAIASTSKEIAAGNIDLSSRTEEQAASLQQTAASMEQLTVTVRQNTEHAKEASGLARDANEITLECNAMVERVVETMGAIESSSVQISEIISLIEGIAFQTNILALNAAVEAARAGERGRGFAVVASEVRALAQKSSTAAKEIKELIEQSSAKVNTGSDLVARAGETMKRVGSAVKRVSDIMSDIASASDEQSLGIEQVNKAISQMDEVTQQNAALVEEAAAAADAMQGQAQQLKDAVGVFRCQPT